MTTVAKLGAVRAATFLAGQTMLSLRGQSMVSRTFLWSSQRLLSVLTLFAGNPTDTFRW
jgi:hypothetical protein